MSSSFGVRGSGEGSTNEYWDVEDEGSYSGVERFSWLDADSSRRGSLWSVDKKESSKKLSRMSLLSFGVVCKNHPPLASSSSRAVSMSNPK